MRSLLFVPADNSPGKLEKGLGSGADVLSARPEDTVAPQAKAAAREAVAPSWPREPECVPSGRACYVRVNALDSGLTDADLDAVMPGGTGWHPAAQDELGRRRPAPRSQARRARGRKRAGRRRDPHHRHRDRDRPLDLPHGHLCGREPSPRRPHLGRGGSVRRSRCRDEPRARWRLSPIPTASPGR